MADRKQFENVAVVDPELTRLLEESKQHQISDEDLNEQRISFAFGNALSSPEITKESVRLTSRSVRLLR